MRQINDHRIEKIFPQSCQKTVVLWYISSSATRLLKEVDDALNLSKIEYDDILDCHGRCFDICELSVMHPTRRFDFSDGFCSRSLNRWIIVIN
jgi:hypothetical protein